MECWEPSQHLLVGTGKQEKSCVEVAGRRTFRVLTSSQQSGKRREVEKEAARMMKVNVRYHAPAAVPAGKDTGTHRIGSWVGPTAVINGLEKRKFS